ncbi:MMPL family protein [Rhodococcus sp. RD6.2]|jgi:RND superfamily putative drug exporter|uniref:MMPL family transporter n=1 Tax=Rhodococcus sp. RD6.2 TaxID=260936 RepID=UPI00063B7FF5|nr:MMPL family transporter [Rhodococcus sp. RD6.2]CRK53659.1 MMPL family protein [Rhodococcus sp. RD6.2]
MSTFLYRVGSAGAAHPWRILSLWAAILATAVTLAVVAGGETRDDYDIPGLASTPGAHLLADRFPAMSGTDARVVVHSPDGAVPAAELSSLGERLAELPGVGFVAPPRLSDGGDTAILDVRYSIPVTDFTGSEGTDPLEAAAADTRTAGLQVEFGGEVHENNSAPSGSAELIGIGVALLILVFAFGSVVAAGLPLLVALTGVGVGGALITAAAAVTDVSTIAPTIATMVGIGVGIDYALLLVTRYADGLRDGMAPREAAGYANGTAGVSVVFAGSTVLVSLFGLRLAGLPVYSSFGYATFLTVGAVMLAAITLVPALCGLAGLRVLGRQRRGVLGRRGRASRPRAAREPLTARWARRVGRRPWPWAVGALLLLLLLAAPVLQMRTWPQDAGSAPTSNTIRVAHDLVAAEFGPGTNGPLLVAVDRSSGVDPTAVAATLSQDPGIARVTPPIVNADGRAAVVTAEPTTAPQNEATTETVHRLRASLPAGVHITGVTATFVDISARLAERLWLVVGIVVALSVALLTVVFRAPVVAVKAAAMNLLSVAATYGVMVAVFQWGWGATALGLPGRTPVSSWVPILMFTILFGLSMDYEVFLLSRVREMWLRSGDPHGAVVQGLAATGRVITSAAAIMIAVFTGFALDADVTVKMLGVGLAVAVLIDVTIVRMVLVPATMALLGRFNWWAPAWLERTLPNLDVEGGATEERLARV